MPKRVSGAAASGDFKRPGGSAAGRLPAVNATITRIFLSSGGAVLMLFDRPVTVDEAGPPTTWSFNGFTSIQPGAGFNFPNGTYLIVNGAVNPGSPVVIAATDPAARTDAGGYVNGGTFVVEDLSKQRDSGQTRACLRCRGNLRYAGFDERV